MTPTLSSYTLRVTDHPCFAGSPAGGSFPTEDLSSAFSATKSLYRLETVQARVGVETGISSSKRTAVWRFGWKRSREGGSALTLDGVRSVRLGVSDCLTGGDGDGLYVRHGDR